MDSKSFRRLVLPGLFISLLLLHFPGRSEHRELKVPKGTSYYINATTGNDENKGTSPGKPFKTLEMLRSLDLLPGDRIFLAAGSRFRGSIYLQNESGKAGSPIRISSYDAGSGGKALIDASGYEAAIVLKNCSFIEIEGLSLTAPDKGDQEVDDKAIGRRCGVLVLVDDSATYDHIWLRKLEIRKVFYENPGFERSLEETRSANGTQSYGWGIRVINSSKHGVLTGLKIDSCAIENVGHTGIKLTSRVPDGENFGIRDFEISNNRVLSTGGPGIQMSGVYRGYIAGNYVKGSGSSDDPRKWGRGSGLWTWASSDILIERNYFLNANGPGDSAGAHIDFNCRNVILQFNLSANNAGGFCEILGNNYNCAYRYNISINDGYRVKGVNNAFQEGKTFWLSGYQGNQKKRKGPFNSYFYNNTIYVSKDIVSKFAINSSASGILIANNIFYIEGESEWVLGDQYVPDSKGNSAIKNVVFENNLYFKGYSWPEEAPIQDRNPLIGDPGFSQTAGLSIVDYIPSNAALVRDKGIQIHAIPDDPIGLYIGLAVKKDILGNPISGLPDLGAIELDPNLK